MNDEAGSSRSEAAAPATGPSRRYLANKELFNTSRLHILHDLITDLDRLIYTQLSIIYLLDCSFLRFALRCFAQYGALTPKSPAWSQVQHPLGLLVGSDLFCLAMHLWQSRPSATSLGTGGYLHGSVLIDFVGQKGPTSTGLLALLDLLVLVLQIVCLGVVDVKGRAAAAGGDQADSTALSQDLEAEERGERRSQQGEDVELQNLASDGSILEGQAPNDGVNDADDDEFPSGEALLAQHSSRSSSSSYLYDAFASGTISIVDVDCFGVIKRHISTGSSARHNTPPPPQPTGSGRLRPRLRFQVGNRVWRI